MARISVSEAGSNNMLSFLDMLSISEGTSNAPLTQDDGYDILVGRTRFSSYAAHPHVLVALPKLGIKSSAAGRYQFLRATWDDLATKLRLKDFSPSNQDRAAIQLIRERGAVADIQAGRIEQAIEKCRNIWASLPGAGYGQFEQRLSTLLDAYKKAGGVLA